MIGSHRLIQAPFAEVVKLVDALASGASGGNPVKVQVLFSAPSEVSNKLNKTLKPASQKA